MFLINFKWAIRNFSPLKITKVSAMITKLKNMAYIDDLLYYNEYEMMKECIKVFEVTSFGN